MSNSRLKEGLSVSSVMVVAEKDTAAAYGSGMLEVLATPSMISFMEKTSMELVQPLLEEGFGTVGISVNIKHLKATAVGEEVTCESTLEKIDGNRLVFRVIVKDTTSKAGEGSHERYIIDEKRFLSKLGRK